MAIAISAVYGAGAGALGLPMPANTAEPRDPHPKTWRALMSPWWPDPEPLLTRGELVDRLRSTGVNITPRTLAFWEQQGVVPRAVRRFHNGKTQAVYPEWMIPLVTSVREMQQAGLSLEEIQGAIQVGIDAGEWVLPPGVTRAAVHDRWRDYHDLAEALGPVVAELSRRWERATGRNLTAVSIQFCDETDRESEHGYGDPWAWLDPDLDGSLPDWDSTVDRLKSMLIGDSVERDRA
jgi:DNA-binding transcriptional MerR regulator